MNPQQKHKPNVRLLVFVTIGLLVSACNTPLDELLYNHTPEPIEVSIQETVLAGQSRADMAAETGVPGQAQAELAAVPDQGNQQAADSELAQANTEYLAGPFKNWFKRTRTPKPTATRNAPTATTTVQATLAFTPTPGVTATESEPTAVPSATPLPTHTALPTDTSVIANTLVPTATQVSTRIAATAEPTMIYLPTATWLPTHTATRTQVVPTPTPTIVIPTSTHTPEPTDEPSPTPTRVSDQDYGIVFKAGFEEANLDEYDENHGEFIHQGVSGSYSFATSPVLNGKYAVKLTIDSRQSGAQAAYLFYYDCRDQYYYSAWYFIPEEIDPAEWWNIWQWKSTADGDSNHSKPMWTLDVTNKPSSNDLRIVLVYRPDSSTLKVPYFNPDVTIPRGRWFQLSAYYDKSTGQDGHVTIWLDGVQIFDVANAHTVLSDNTLYWSVNHYADSISPMPSSIYIDDVIVSTVRIPPDYRLP
ncbi:MAG: heparin lyase I family protein [Anaerolineae bacterium]|nr:heparin lyase I family protein [Anaerolineae bacterium]